MADKKKTKRPSEDTTAAAAVYASAAVGETQLYTEVKATQWPIIYGPEYNIGFLGLEKLHPFDAGKWGRVYEFLKVAGMIRDDTTVRPVEATERDLRVVHSKSYINSLKWSMTVAGITEVPPVALLPNFIVQRKVLRPFRYQTGGTILAAKLAVERGWGINIGGGFHHCCADRGGGFCAYADISLAIKFLFHSNPRIKKAMIIDLDAHQGNGYARDFMEDDQVYIMDVYNRGIYPHDGYAKRAIKKKVELSHFTEDEQYLELVATNFAEALEEFTPDILVYNAGTDILEGDPLGSLSISPQGIIDRDELVFRMAKEERKIPVIMVTSGGYQRSTSRIIADSILNLYEKKLIGCSEAENCPAPSLEDRKTNLPRSSSEVSLFARIKNVCLYRSSTADTSPACPEKPFAPSVDHSHTARSLSRLSKDEDLAENSMLKETPSKSCSDLRFSFKDESDVDISQLLEARFGQMSGKGMSGDASCDTRNKTTAELRTDTEGVSGMGDNSDDGFGVTVGVCANTREGVRTVDSLGPALGGSDATGNAVLNVDILASGRHMDAEEPIA